MDRSSGAKASAPRMPDRVSPLYHQVYRHLRQLITEGGVEGGRPLPSEPALAARYGVSRVTVRKTLDRLQADGLVDRRRGVGTFPVGAGSQTGKANISGLLESLISLDQSTTAINLDWARAAAEGEAASFLGPGRHLRIVRLRSHRGQPISLTTLGVPLAHARHLSRRDGADVPVILRLERAGIIAERADQVITALPADALAAERLGVAVGAPLIAMRRRMVDAARAPVLYQESLYAPDRFEYRMVLTRTSVGPTAQWTPIG